MDSMPPEIAAIICNEIDQGDVPSLRLVSRFWNDIASPYLVHEPRLVFKQDSFDRLLSLSRHPYFSTLVTELVYEPNTLNKPDRASWERCTPILHLDDVPNPPGPNPTERDWRAYHRSCKKLVIHEERYSKDELDTAWRVYKRLYQEQMNLREREYGLTELSEAIRNFPNLREVSMNHGWALWNRPGRANDLGINSYAEALACTGIDEWPSAPCGVPQMRSLMLALHRANVHLQSFRIGHVSWEFLKLESEILKRMGEVLKPVQQLEIAIYTGRNEESDEPGAEIPECSWFLAGNDSLREFLSAAAMVEDLRIQFDWIEPTYAPADLGDIVKSTQWSYLRQLSLECISMTDDDWLAFLKRHTVTLRELELCSIELSSGAWVDVLESMQQILNSCLVRFEQQLTNVYPEQLWYLEPEAWASHSDMRSQANRIREALEDFFTHGGPCPLRDEEAHPSRGFD